MPFKPGQSGNPKGKPKGTRHRRSRMPEMRDYVLPHMKDIIDRTVEMARNGDVAAIKLLLDRVMPTVKPIDSGVDLPELEDVSPIEGLKVIRRNLANKVLSPQQAETIQSQLCREIELTQNIAFDSFMSRVAQGENPAVVAQEMLGSPGTLRIVGKHSAEKAA